MKRVAGLLTIALAIGVADLKADDWPQWRGPLREGEWREKGLLKSLPLEGLRVRWRSPIGQGYSGPAVAEEKVFLTDRITGPDRERVLCFDEATGRLLWEHAYPCEYGEMEYGNGPRATPTVHRGKVYTLGTKGHLFCFESTTGRVLWAKDLVRDYGAREPRYGISAAPLIEEDLLIVGVGGLPDASVVAFDRDSGEERWRALSDPQAYSAPVVITAGGVRQAIVWSAENVNSLNPKTGSSYWHVPFETTFDDAQVVASPVLQGDLLLCMAAWGRGSMMLRLDRDKPAAAIAWRTRKDPTTSFSTPWFPEGDHFYSVLNDGSLACLAAATGDTIWKTLEPTGDRVGHAHITPIFDGGPGPVRVLLFNQRGHLILARLTPEGYEEIGRTLLVEATAGYRPQGAVTWAHPAYANQCVFARNDRELVCVSLAESDLPKEMSAEPDSVDFRRFTSLAGRDAAQGVAISPDGSLLAAGTWSGNVRLIDWAGGEPLPSPKKHRSSVASVAFSPDGKRLISGGGNEFYSGSNNYQKNAELVLWDREAGKELARLAGHEDKVYAAVFSPDGRTVASGAADKTIKLWDAGPTLTERAVLRGHDDAVSALAFSPDGRTLVSAGWDGALRRWDAATGEDLGLIGSLEEPIHTVAWSPDGRWLATGGADWAVRLWDAEKREPTNVLTGHGGAVYSVAFSPDGKTLATGSGDETIRLWNVPSGVEILKLRGHLSGINAVAFTPDGKALASASRDDAVRVWTLPEPD